METDLPALANPPGQPPQDNDAETKGKGEFANPICKQTYHALPRIYGKKKKTANTHKKRGDDNKNEHSHNETRSRNYFSSPQNNGTSSMLTSKKDKIVRTRLSEPKHPSHCSKPNCACRLEEQALERMRAKRNSTSMMFRKVKLPDIQKFELEDLESKYKVSVQGPTAESNFRKSGLQIIIQQQSQKNLPLKKTPEKSLLSKTFMPNLSNLHDKHKGNLKLFKNRHKFNIKINKHKFQISEEQQQQSPNEEEACPDHRKSSTRYKTEQSSSTPKFSRSVMVSTVMFKSHKKSNTNFAHLNSAEKDLPAKLRRNPSQLSNGLFRVPQEHQYKEYLREYRNMNERFDLRAVIRSPNFRIQKGENSVYFGELNGQQKRQGLGILISEKQIFEGKFENNFKLEGYERNIDGIYMGGYKDGLRSGFGTFCWHNNEIFEGNWENGTKNGFGVWRSPRGDKYEGEWHLNRQHGQGVFEHKTSTYKGEFKNFLKDGKGEETFTNGDRYIGQYSLGKPHGKGRYEWQKGGFYQGDFKQGMREGQGMWIDSQKTKYEVQALSKPISSTDLEWKPTRRAKDSRVSSLKATEQKEGCTTRIIPSRRQGKSENKSTLIFFHFIFRVAQQLCIKEFPGYSNYNSRLQKKMKKGGKIGEYEIIRKIGSGLTAQVFEAQGKDSVRVSIKAIQGSFYRSQIGSQLIQNQIKILASLNHRNTLKLVEKVESEGKVMIVTNYCEEGDLQGYLSKHKRLSESQALRLVRGIVEGCIYLQSKNIVHRDMKPSNIFLDKGEPIIADFGFAVLTSDKKLMSVNAGSPLYMPLQSLRDKKFSQKSDVFAVGVCLYEMLAGKTPWPAKSEKQLMEALKSPPKIDAGISGRTSKIIQKCLSRDPSQRPSFSELLNLITDQNVKVEAKPINREKSVSFNINSCLKKKTKQNKENVEPKASQASRQKSLTVHAKQNPVNRKVVPIMESQFLARVNPDQFSFLPGSVISKFKCILHRYREIMEPGSGSCELPLLPEKDELISEVEKCKTEPELCRSIESFMRRLFRLTKNYKEYKNCLQSLEKLHERVISMTM